MNPIFENLLGVLGGAQNISSEATTNLWSQLKPWLTRISTNGAVKWLPRAASQMPCAVPHYHAGNPVGACEHVAIDSCIVCKQPVCLDHCFVNDHCEVICFLCVQKLGGGSSQKQTRPKQNTGGSASSDPKKAEAQNRAWWALGVLGLEENATWDAVKAAHRSVSAKWHPDKPGGDEARFKDAQKAFETMKVIFGEA